MNPEAIIYYLVLADSLFANIGAWLFPGWYKKNFPGLSKYIPLTKGWAIVYLILIIWIGTLLAKLNIL